MFDCWLVRSVLIYAIVFNALKLVIGILAEFSIVKGSAYKTIF
jgi:hypothetical protein